jgi:TRAP-type mannitol/chloroaromatic compound transport system substrate-binding protein
MKRRHFTGCAAIATASTALAGCGRSSVPATVVQPNQSNIRWRMITSWTKNISAMNAAEMICQAVSDMTQGQFVITPYASGEIAPGLEALDKVQDGTVECGHTLSYYYTKKDAALAFASTLPFGLTAQQQNAWLYYGGGMDKTQDLYRNLGVMGFPAGNTSAQMGGWFQKQVNTVAELKGLKMRIPGLGGQVMTRLGVEVKTLAGGDIYKALEKQEIDAAEWQGPDDDKSLGLDRVTSFYYYPGWWEPGTAYTFVVNLQAWEKLPADYQKMLQSAAAAANIQILARYDALNAQVFKQLLADGTKLLPFSSEILKAAHKASFELYDELSQQHPTFKTIYTQWNEFRRQIYQWNQLNELSFAEYAFRQASDS